MKPPSARCNFKWRKGFVTGVNSANNIEVDYVPRHILDVRHVVVSEDVRIQEEEDRQEAMDRELSSRNRRRSGVTPRVRDPGQNSKWKLPKPFVPRILRPFGASLSITALRSCVDDLR